MKAVMVMYDSLNRHMLPNYGCDWTLAPNFIRLGERAVTFDNHYVGSMPCMPARRELHTGRHNFLHRSWGPFEPFDDSTFSILKHNGVYAHLVSDHYHYWEDGGATYHPRYSSWVNLRGQEGDAWKGEVADPEIPEHLGRIARQYWVNRKYMQEEKLTPPGADLRRRARVPSDQPRPGQLVPADRDLRSPRAVLHPETVEGPLQLRLGRPALRVAEVRAGDRGSGCSGVPALSVRGATDPVRPLPRHGDRLHGCPRHVARHAASRRHRSRLPAGRARLVGQGAHALVQRDGPHPAFHLGPALPAPGGVA